VIAGALAAVAPAAHAERVERPDTDSSSVQIFWYQLQQRMYALVAEFSRDDTTAARGDEILTELRSIGSAWNVACKPFYGNIAKLPPEQMATGSVHQVPASVGSLSPDQPAPPSGPAAPRQPAPPLSHG